MGSQKFNILKVEWTRKYAPDACHPSMTTDYPRSHLIQFELVVDSRSITQS